jgi:CubicO group peptidase (beta-lactamase class C family)
MKRRFFLQTSVILGLGAKVQAKVDRSRIEQAADVMRVACSNGEISAAAMYVSQKSSRYSYAFGAAQDENAMFLLGSISKPIAMTAVMTLYDRGEFKLEDKVKKYLPEFTSDGARRSHHWATHDARLRTS